MRSQHAKHTAQRKSVPGHRGERRGASPSGPEMAGKMPGRRGESRSLKLPSLISFSNCIASSALPGTPPWWRVEVDTWRLWSLRSCGLARESFSASDTAGMRAAARMQYEKSSGAAQSNGVIRSILSVT